MDRTYNGAMTGLPKCRIRKLYVDLPDGQLHLHCREGTDPPVIFLHQTASSAQSFDPLLEVLACPNRLVALDTPGFGGSFAPVGRPEMEAYATWVLETLDALNIGQAHLFGHHTGASLAIEIARTAPQRVLSLSLAGPVFMSEAEREEFGADYHEPIAPQREGSHLQVNWDYAAKFNPECPVEILHQEVTAMLRAWRGRAQAYGAVAHHDTQAAAENLSLPVLLLTSPDDFFHSTFSRAQEIFPDAVIAQTAGGNFQPTVDPGGVAAAFEAFLAQLNDAETGS